MHKHVYTPKARSFSGSLIALMVQQKECCSFPVDSAIPAEPKVESGRSYVQLDWTGFWLLLPTVPF